LFVEDTIRSKNIMEGHAR